MAGVKTGCVQAASDSLSLPLQWVNGVKVTQHEGGHLPFEVEIGSLLRENPTTPCRITIAVNNTLDIGTLPPGSIQHLDDPTR